MKEILVNKIYSKDKYYTDAPFNKCNLEYSLQEFINTQISRKLFDHINYNLYEVGIVLLEGYLKNGDKIEVWGTRNVTKTISILFCTKEKNFNISSVERLKHYDN